jgi:hypothetical protein
VSIGTAGTVAALSERRIDSYSAVRSPLQLRTFAKDRQNFVSGFRAGKTLAHRTIIQKFRDRSQRPQMCLKLIFRDDKKNNEFYGRVIQRIELDAFGRPSERRHDFVEPIG